MKTLASDGGVRSGKHSPVPTRNPSVPQTMVTEQAAQGSSPPDLRIQYLHQIHANHQVSPSSWV